MQDTNPKQRGEETEAAVLAQLVSKGYTVSQPFGENCPYDLIVDDGEELTKVQVKTGSLKQDRIVAQINRTRFNSSGHTNSPYEGGDVDVFCVYAPEDGDVYWVPFEETSKTRITIRLEPPKNNQSKGVMMASDYVL